MGESSSSLVLLTRRSSLPRLEKFLEKSLFSDPSRAVNVLKIISTELFDNIVDHGKGVFPPLVFIRLSKGLGYTVKLCYTAFNFSAFICALEERKADHSLGERKQVLRYSSKSERYRGLGLMMVVSLGADIWAKKGILNCISIRYPSLSEQ